MDPEKLRALLAVLTEAGVRRATFDASWLREVEFTPARVAGASATAAFVGPDGKPVDLSAGAPELADDSADEKIAAANFQRGDKPKP